MLVMIDTVEKGMGSDIILNLEIIQHDRCTYSVPLGKGCLGTPLQSALSVHCVHCFDWC